MSDDYDDIGHNSKAARKKAMAALEKAKLIEQKQLKNGAKWKRDGKTMRLIK